MRTCGAILLIVAVVVTYRSDAVRAQTRSWTYLLATTPAPAKTIARVTVTETRTRKNRTLSLTLLLKGKKLPRGTVQLDKSGELVGFSTPRFPKLSFKRDATGFRISGPAHPRLAHRSRLIAPKGTILFDQASPLGFFQALVHVSRPFKGLKMIPYLYSRQLSLNWLYAIEAGRHRLKVGNKSVNARKILLFSTGGGVLLFVHNGTLIRAEVPLKGLWIRLQGSELLTVAPRKPAKTYLEQEVRIKNGDVTLAGTLSSPKNSGDKRLPAVIMLSGSGAQDRNEDAPGLPLRIFSALADALTPLGVVVLRYDDRGFGKSSGKFANQPVKSFISDGAAALTFLRKHARVDSKRIWLIGHSEGTIHAAKIAAVHPGWVAGIVALGAMGLSSETVYFMQNIMIGEGGPEDALQSAGLIFALRRALKSKLPMRKTLARELKERPEMRVVLRNETNLKDVLTYDGVGTWKAVKCPLFFVTGGLDSQVPPGHARYSARAAIQGGNTDVKVTILKDLDHVFRKSLFGFMGEYTDRFRPLAPELVQTVVEYLKPRLR